MKIKFLFFTLILTMLSGMLYATETVTQTVTETVTATITVTNSVTVSPTITMTSTITDTITVSPTMTPTATITPTFTSTPTPQGKVFAYPNPAYSNTMTIAYPLDEAKTAKRVIVILRTLTGSEAGRIYDDTPNGYTKFDISKLARGIYYYKLIVRYTDGTEVDQPFEKFAVVK